MRERLFALLAMGDTSFAVPPEKHDRLAVAYAKAATGELTVWDHPHSTRWADPLESAHAGLPRESDQGPRENEKASSDGATDRDQTEP